MAQIEGKEIKKENKVIKENVYTNTYVYTNFLNIQKRKLKKDYLACVRVNSFLWKKFKKLAESIGFSRNQLLNLLIESFCNHTVIKPMEKYLNINMNVNLVPVKVVQQTLINKPTKIKDWIIMKEMEKWIELGEEQLEKEGRVYPGVKRKILSLLPKLSHLDSNLHKRIKKLFMR